MSGPVCTCEYCQPSLRDEQRKERVTINVDTCLLGRQLRQDMTSAQWDRYHRTGEHFEYTYGGSMVDVDRDGRPKQETNCILA